MGSALNLMGFQREDRFAAFDLRPLTKQFELQVQSVWKSPP